MAENEEHSETDDSKVTSKETNEENIETPEVIDDGAETVDPWSADKKYELLDEFLDMIEIGEEFAEERGKFLKKWTAFMQVHSEALGEDSEIIGANERA